jgi:hypothetical protein
VPDLFREFLFSEELQGAVNVEDVALRLDDVMGGDHTE